MGVKSINFSLENEAWLSNSSAGNISSLVNTIITKERLGQTMLTNQTMKMVQAFVNDQALIGFSVKLETLVNQSVQEFIRNRQMTVTQSNTGHEKQKN